MRTTPRSQYQKARHIQDTTTRDTVERKANAYADLPEL
jgi:hypothetical protein